MEEDQLDGQGTPNIGDETLQSILSNIQSGNSGNDTSGDPDSPGFKVTKCSY